MNGSRDVIFPDSYRRPLIDSYLYNDFTLLKKYQHFYF